MDADDSLPDAEDHQVQIFPQIILGRGCGVDEIETGRGSNKVRVLQIHEKKMKVCTVLYGLYGFKIKVCHECHTCHDSKCYSIC